MLVLNRPKNYFKLDFQSVLFTDESRANLYGPDGWSKVWVPEEAEIPDRVRRQQGSESVMFWAEIIGFKLLGSYRVPEGVKLTSKTYVKFLKANFASPWCKKQRAFLKRQLVFMQDNLNFSLCVIFVS